MKIVLILLFGFFLINSVLALDCQYTETENDEVEDFYFKEGNNYLYYNVLEIKNFQQSSRNGDRYITYSTSPVKFDVKNNYLEQIEFYLIFIMNGEEQRINQTIDSGGFKTIEYGYPNNIDNSTFKFEIISPSNLEYVFEKRIYPREVCKKCGNEICLDDGASCNPLYDDSKCGSGICNIAGFCGSQKVVDCSNGKLSCQDKICLESSTKEEGESYMCSFECKSDRFENGTCLKSTEQIKIDKEAFWRRIIIFGVIVIIVSSFFVWWFAFHKRDKAKKEYENFIRKIKNLEEKEVLSKKKIDELNEIFEKQKKEINEEISKLKKRRQNASQEAKRKIDNELKKYDEKLIKAREEASKEIEKQRLAKEEAEKEKRRYQEEMNEIERTKPEREIELLQNEYKKEYETGGRKIKFDKIKQRFMISSLYHAPEPLARFVYKKIDKNIGNKKVHHINYNQLIDEPWNLIALTQEQHEKIRHENLIKGDWWGGIKEIKRALNWQDSDFPEHIQKEIEKRNKASSTPR